MSEEQVKSEQAVELVERTTVCTKEALDVGEAVKAIVESIGTAAQDGLQWTDIVSVVKDSWEKAKEGIVGIKQMPVEFKAEPFKASQSILIPVSEGVDNMLKSILKK